MICIASPSLDHLSGSLTGWKESAKSISDVIASITREERAVSL